MSISHCPGAGSATDRLASAVGVVEPTPCSVFVGVASATTSVPDGENSVYEYELSGLASAVLNDTLISCCPAGTSTKNSEFSGFERPTLVPIGAWNGPPVDGITVRASSGTDISWSPGEVASGTPTLSVAEPRAGTLTGLPLTFEVT